MKISSVSLTQKREGKYGIQKSEKTEKKVEGVRRKFYNKSHLQSRGGKRRTRPGQGDCHTRKFPNDDAGERGKSTMRKMRVP